VDFAHHGDAGVVRAGDPDGVDSARLQHGVEARKHRAGSEPVGIGLRGERRAALLARRHDAGNDDIAHSQERLEMELGHEPGADETDPQGAARPGLCHARHRSTHRGELGAGFIQSN